jgi:hypothetical protein
MIPQKTDMPFSKYREAHIDFKLQNGFIRKPPYIMRQENRFITEKTIDAKEEIPLVLVRR